MLVDYLHLQKFDERCKIKLEEIIMSEIILNTSTLPEPLFRLIGAEKVSISKSNGTIIMKPIKEDVDYIKELYGSCANSGLTVDKFLEWTHEDF
jgi:virulence-associated protein VagC